MSLTTTIFREATENLAPVWWESKWFISVLGALLAYIFRKDFPKLLFRKERNKKKLVDGLRASADTSATMDIIRQLPGVYQVVLLEVGNGGSLPKPGTKIYTRAIDARVDVDPKGEKRANLLNGYSEFRVDSHYINMTTQVSTTKKPYRFVTATEEACILRSIYRDIGVTYSEIYSVFSDTKKWREIILSVQSIDEEERFDSDEVRAVIELCVRRIQHNFDVWE